MNLLLSFRPLQQLEKDLEGVRPEDLENGAPDAPITSADNIVGTMSESLLYLFAVLQGKQREVKRMLWQHEMNVHRANIPDAEKLKACKRAHKELMPHVTYVEFVKETFWASLREEHPELNAHPDIGVRKGGLVVWVDTEKQVREALGEVLDAFAHIFPGESIPGAFPFLNGRLLEEEEDDPDGPIGKAC